MHRKFFVLFALIVLVCTQFACGGSGDTGVAPDTNISDVEPTSDSPVPTDNPIPEELRDVAVMQGSVVVHGTEGYVMSTQGLSPEILAKRAACFTALSQEESSDSCTANLEGEFSRMPGSCTCSPKAQAAKDGICSDS